VDLEPMDDFERELQAAFARRPAPLDLKRKVMQRAWERAGQSHRRMVWFERIAASLVLAVVVTGALVWRNVQEKRKGEEAKQQVFTALRIANHALEQMNVQLQERDSK
jgi:hypothetical protein